MGQGKSKSPQLSKVKTVDKMESLQTNALKVLADEFLSKIPELGSIDHQKICNILKRNLATKIDDGEWLPETVVDVILYRDQNRENILDKAIKYKCGALLVYLINLNSKIPAYFRLHEIIVKISNQVANTIANDPLISIETSILALVKLTNMIKSNERKNQFINAVLELINSTENQKLYIWQLEPNGYVKELRGRRQYKL